ncbi:GNAT family N-acetyltransferase [Desulfatiferula olefinivorans]
MMIRPYREGDWAGLWPMIEGVFRAGETYACDPLITEAEAKRLWVDLPRETFVAVGDDRSIMGTYYIKPNQPGPGSHVCNCGYITADRARRQGVATALCAHSQQTASAMGFRAMQFNLVVSTNTGAVDLWKKMDYRVVGILPGAFHSPSAGFVDALVMFKALGKPGDQSS